MSSTEFVVSLTTYPKRYLSIDSVLIGILNQTYLPTEVHLNLTEEDWLKFPSSLFDHDFAFRVTINICDDLGPAKKMIPTLIRERNRPIIVVDDDLILKTDLFEKLIIEHVKFPADLIAARAHLIRRDDKGALCRYEDWEHNFKGGKLLNGELFPTSGSGMLVPPGAFHPNVSNIDLYKELSWHTDDLWYFWHMRMNSRNCRLIVGYDELNYIPGTQFYGLWNNGNRFRNDTNIKRLHEELADYITFTSRIYGEI